MRKIIVIVLGVALVSQSADVFAAAAAVQRKRQQQAMQQQVIEQAIAQQQQAYAQQVQAAQQQAYVQQVQVAQQQAIQQEMIKRYQEEQMKQQVQQILVQVQQQKAAYEQAKALRQQQVEIVDAQQMAMATQLMEKYKEAIIQEAVKQKVTLDAIQMARVQEMAKAQAELAAMQTMQAAQAKTQAQAMALAGAMQNRPYEQLSNDQIQDEVDISDVWRKLDQDSRAWTLLVDNQAKVATVSEYMDRFAKLGIHIRGIPADYVQLIDQMAIQNPALLNNPFQNIIQLVAVMQYDFDNGSDKDEMARKMLGPQMYQANRQRLGR